MKVANINFKTIFDSSLKQGKAFPPNFNHPGG